MAVDPHAPLRRQVARLRAGCEMVASPDDVCATRLSINT